MPLVPIGITFVRFIRAVWAAFRDPETRGLVLFTGIILLSGMLFYHNVEGWSWIDSLYFSVITLTTVGYGDLTPETTLGKLFTIVYILIGLGILLAFINLVAQHSFSQGIIGRRNKQKEENSDPLTGTITDSN